MGVFDESDRFYTKASGAEVTKLSEMTESIEPLEPIEVVPNKAPSSQYDGAYEIYDLDLPKKKNKNDRKLKIPVIRLVEL